MQWLYATLLALGLLGVFGFVARVAYVAYAAYRESRFGQAPTPAATAAPPADIPPAATVDLAIEFAPSSKQWSGSSGGELPLKMLTFRQYECLEDARYGFNIVGVTRLELQNEQPLKTRAHGKKTVASLAKHGFLVGNDEQGFSITDHGLNALAVCSVRY